MPSVGSSTGASSAGGSAAGVSCAGAGRAAGSAGVCGTASISSSRRPSSALARSVSAVA